MAHQLRSRPIDVVEVIHTEFEDEEDGDFRSPLSVVESATSTFKMVESEAKVCCTCAVLTNEGGAFTRYFVEGY